MTSLTYIISTNASQSIYFLDELTLYDITSFTLRLSDVNETNIIPQFITVDWGDGSAPEVKNNTFLQPSNSILIATNKNYEILFSDFNHIYYPSSTSLCKKLSCQVLVESISGINIWCILPIKIISPSYALKIEDITLLQTNILKDFKVHSVFSTKAEGTGIEIAFDTVSLN